MGRGDFPDALFGLADSFTVTEPRHGKVFLPERCVLWELMQLDQRHGASESTRRQSNGGTLGQSHNEGCTSPEDHSEGKSLINMSLDPTTPHLL